jgi:hypothetical protein
MILRQHEQNGRITAGVVTEAFFLGAGMGSGGYGNLKDFCCSSDNTAGIWS